MTKPKNTNGIQTKFGFKNYSVLDDYEPTLCRDIPVVIEGLVIKARQYKDDPNNLIFQELVDHIFITSNIGTHRDPTRLPYRNYKQSQIGCFPSNVPEIVDHEHDWVIETLKPHIHTEADRSAIYRRLPYSRDLLLSLVCPDWELVSTSTGLGIIAADNFTDQLCPDTAASSVPTDSFRRNELPRLKLSELSYNLISKYIISDPERLAGYVSISRLMLNAEEDKGILYVDLVDTDYYLVTICRPLGWGGIQDDF